MKGINEEVQAGTEMKVTPAEVEKKECNCEECTCDNSEDIVMEDIPNFDKKKFVRTNQGLVYLTEGAPEDLVKLYDQSGREVSSVLEMILPDDLVNHQTVESVSTGSEGLEINLNYFGVKSKITSEQEMFSLVLREEISLWVETINIYLNRTNQAEGLKEENIGDVLTLTMNNDLLRKTIELLCSNVNLNVVKAIVVDKENIADVQIGTLLSLTLNRPMFYIQSLNLLEKWADLVGKIPEDPNRTTMDSETAVPIIMYSTYYDKEKADNLMASFSDKTRVYFEYQLALFESKTNKVEDYGNDICVFIEGDTIKQENTRKDEVDSVSKVVEFIPKIED